MHYLGQDGFCLFVFSVTRGLAILIRGRTNTFWVRLGPEQAGSNERRPCMQCSSQHAAGKLSAGSRAGWPWAEGWGSMWSQDKRALVLRRELAATFINNGEGGRRP